MRSLILCTLVLLAGALAADELKSQYITLDNTKLLAKPAAFSKTMKTLNDKYKSDNVVWLAINSSNYVTNDQDQKWAAEQGITYPILNDAPGTVGHLYGATNTPQMFIIGRDGVLLYKGGIDNDRGGKKEGADKINYVDQGLSEIMAGKPVSVPESEPYGCTVKYKGVH